MSELVNTYSADTSAHLLWKRANIWVWNQSQIQKKDNGNAHGFI